MRRRLPPTRLPNGRRTSSTAISPNPISASTCRWPTVGTAFQQRVWGAIASIPRGHVRTYGDLARLLGSAPRAVGQACGANWFPLVVPCHRVTAAGGLGGFSNSADADGFHLGVKRWLLAHEGVERYR